MNQELWNRILTFDFDYPHSEYGFTTRLAKENFWTKKFTTDAILEYKKFMFLAAISNTMVSPSETVDVVWHQHLIFTKSYYKFCEILGKQIQHIPSTRNKEDFEKFKQAKEQTKILYEKEFGIQPENIWKFNNMFESLNLEKAKYKLRTFINFGIIAFVFSIFPAYFILNPFYVRIEGSAFIFLFFVLAFMVFFVLEIYNKNKLNQLISEIDKTSFLYELSPNELIYLKKQNLVNVINVSINELIKENVIKITDNRQIVLLKNEPIKSIEAFQIISLFPKNKTVAYSNLISRLKFKPIFSNTGNSMDAVLKFITKSKKFNSLFYINFLFVAVLILLEFTRITTGLIHLKNILIIITLTVFLIIYSISFLNGLVKKVSTNIIPKYYMNHLIPKEKNKSEWNYFLLGTSALFWTFKPIAEEFISKKNQTDSCSSCGTSCGTTCGSSGGCSGCGN